MIEHTPNCRPLIKVLILRLLLLLASKAIRSRLSGLNQHVKVRRWPVVPRALLVLLLTIPRIQLVSLSDDLLLLLELEGCAVLVKASARLEYYLAW